MSDITDILIESFPLDQSSGNETGDKASVVLTDNNTVGSATGLVNANARSFDESADEYFSLASATASSSGFDPGTGDFAIELWFYPVDTSAELRALVSYGRQNTTDPGYRILHRGSANELNCIICDGTSSITVTLSGGISTSSWNHIVLNFDRDGNLSGRANGQAMSGADDISSFSSDDLQPTSDFRVGWHSSNQYFDGRIGPLRLYDALLDADMANWLYNRGSGRAYADLTDYVAPTKAAYSLDDEEDFYDAQVDLTNEGTVTFTTGKVGDAASFNGTDQRLYSESPLYKSVADEKISIDCWFKADTISSAMGIAGQSNSSYSLQLLSSGTLRFRTNHVTDGVKTVDWGSTLSAGTWYYVHAYHDPDTDTIGISVDDGTVVTTATGGNALVVNTNDFVIGAIGTGNWYDGLVDQVRFLRGEILTSGERTSAYNSGDGAEFTADGGVTGTLALTDGGETIAMSGGVLVSGTLSLTDGAETLAMTGNVPVTGTLALTDGGESIALSGTQVATGTLVLTDAGETISLGGSVLVQGTLSLTDGGETIALSGSNQITGTLALTDAGESLDFSGGVVISGTFTITDGGETISFTDAIAGNVRDIALSATPYMSITMTAQPYVE